MEQQGPVLGFWAWYFIGWLGILLYIGFKAIEAGDKKIEAAWNFTKENSLSIVVNLIAYSAVVLIWYTDGISFMGMDKGDLGGMVIVVAMAGSTLFRSLLGVVLKKAPPPDPGV